MKRIASGPRPVLEPAFQVRTWGRVLDSCSQSSDITLSPIEVTFSVIEKHTHVAFDIERDLFECVRGKSAVALVRPRAHNASGSEDVDASSRSARALLSSAELGRVSGPDRRVQLAGRLACR